MTPTTSILYYLNPLFDLSLGKYPTDGLKRSASEMSTLFIPVAGPSEKVLIDVAVPADYPEYLFSCGLDQPGLVTHGEHCNNAEGVCWGWNTDAIEKLKLAGAQCDYPDLEIVKAVNSRKFSFGVNLSTETGVPGAHFIESMEQLMLTMESWDRFPLVIKPLYGNAGYGFVRKETATLSESELRQVNLFLQNDNGVTVEPWYNRLEDISSKCHIDPDGTVKDIRHHRTLSNKAGTFFADWIDPNDVTVSKWRDTLDRAVNETAKQLSKRGYFGPAGFDSFTWLNKSGIEQLAAIIEINARHPMSTIAYALYDKLCPGKTATFRFISKKRHALPDDYTSLKKNLGKDAFNPETKEGIVLVTPLRLHHDTQWVQPARSTFFIAAKSSEELLILDERLRKILSRSK